MAFEDEVRSKVLGYTKEIFSWAELDPDGDISFEFGLMLSRCHAPKVLK
jgi:hypothetical protein